MLDNWLAGWFAFVAIAAMYISRIPREEQLMRDTFGAEKVDYIQRTGRYLLRLWSPRQVEASD